MKTTSFVVPGQYRPITLAEKPFLECSMTNPETKKNEENEVIDVTKITFDENGEIIGLDVKDLDDVAGGLKSSNNGCGNNVSC